MIWAEVRGDDEVSVLDRRIEPRVWRQALSVALFSVAVVISTFVLMEITQISFDAVYMRRCRRSPPWGYPQVLPRPCRPLGGWCWWL